MTVSRRSFLAGLLATATAPVLPRAPQGTAYIVYEEIPLEKFGNREFTYYWTPTIQTLSSQSWRQLQALWLDRERVI